MTLTFMFVLHIIKIKHTKVHDIYCIKITVSNTLPQPSNDLILSIFKCLENLQTLLLESI